VRQGEANRVIGEHQLNRESSRSHCVFTLALALEREGASDGGGGGGGGGRGTVSSKISLVDLAGSERVSKTRSEGLVLKEAGHINKSLHILEQVMNARSGVRGWNTATAVGHGCVAPWPRRHARGQSKGHLLRGAILLFGLPHGLRPTHAPQLPRALEHA
jgi:hypothetical protein